MRFHGTLVGTAIFCLVVLSVVAVGGIAGDTPTAEQDDRLVGAEGEDAIPTQDASGVAIDSALAESDGTVEVLVGLSDAGGAASVAELQSQAERSQRPVRRFAEQRPGVTVEKRFWLTNAVLATVDTDRVPLSALATVDGVTDLNANADVQAADATTARSAGATPSAGETSVRPAGPLTPATATTVGTPVPGPQAAAATAAGPASYDTTYGLEQINATAVWNTSGTMGGGTSVAVLDTGIDPDHPDINLTEWAEFDGTGNEELGSSPEDFDPTGHGTHTSGTVSGGNASGEYIGVAPETSLYHGAVLTDNCGSSNGCEGTFAQIIGGMEWAVANDVDVLSMSLGTGNKNPDAIDAVRNAISEGTIVVTSSGNNGVGTSGSPGNYYDSISVGMTDSDENVNFQSSGEVIDTDAMWEGEAPADWPDEYVVPAVSAPGVDIKSAQAGGGYTNKLGTSMAAPHVAGGVALAQAATEDQISHDQMMNALEATARKPPGASAPAGERDTRYGSGIVDLPALVGLLETGLTADFSHSPSEPQPGETVTFEANSSLGTIETYEWDFDADDGNDTADATGEVVTHEFDADGEYNVTLTVESTSGETDTVATNVTVATPFVDDQWSVDIGGPVQTSPTVVNDTVFIGSANGTVHALNATTGDSEWVYETNDSVWSSPTVVEGAAYVGSNDGTLYALNATTGEKRWGYATGDSVVSSPTVADGSVFVGSDSGVLTAVDAASGLAEWTAAANDSIRSSPTVANGTVYVGSHDNNTRAYDADDGDLQWSFEHGGSVYSSPTVATVGTGNDTTEAGTQDATDQNVADQNATVFVGSFDGNVTALDATTGETQWTFQTGGDVWSSPTVANDTVYVGSDDEAVYALNGTTGEQEWTYETSAIVDSSPTVVDDSVVVGGWDETLHVINATTGDDRATHSLGGSVVTASPTVVDGTIYLGSNSNAVVALSSQLNGSSEGTRTALGTLGHHGTWADQTPTAAFTFDPVTPTPGGNVSFDATASTGNLTAYDWSFDDSGMEIASTTGKEVVQSFPEPGEYTVTLTITTAGNETETRTRTVSVGPPPVVNEQPRDLDGDGLYEAVRGDGDATVFDVQTFFSNLDSPAIQDNAAYYDFQPSEPPAVDVFDVQALFNTVS